MGRIVGLDYGRSKIGLALSDPTGILATPLFSLQHDPRVMSQLYDRLHGYGVETVVIGLPLMMNGTEGEMALEVRNFGKFLGEATGWKIMFWDERLSSAQAEKLLHGVGVCRKKRAKASDMIAASMILQSYLDSKQGWA